MTWRRLRCRRQDLQRRESEAVEAGLEAARKWPRRVRHRSRVLSRVKDASVCILGPESPNMLTVKRPRRLIAGLTRDQTYAGVWNLIN